MKIDYHRKFQRYLSDQRILKSRWAKYAKCRDLTCDTLYPIGRTRQARIAEKVCTDCSVRHECLNLALLGGETDGIWGGTTEEERKELIDLVNEVIDPKVFWDDSSAEIVSGIASEWLKDK